MFYQAISTAWAAVFNPARTVLSLVAALCVLGISAPGLAQETTSSIRGNVTEDGGQTVEGATVTVTDTRTSGRRTATTTPTGKYSVSGVQAGGPYTVEIDSPNTGCVINGKFGFIQTIGTCGGSFIEIENKL